MSLITMKDIRATILIDLKNKAEKELFRNLDYSRRKNVQTAISNNLSFQESTSEEDLKKGYSIYAQVVIDGGTIPIPYSQWKEIVDPKKNKFFVIRHNKEIVGCFGVKEITRRFYGQNSDEKGIRPVVFANDRAFNDYRPNDFMYWNTILYGLKNGYNFVDLGGYQLKARDHLIGVNSFKMKWGGEIFCYYEDYPFFKAIGRKLIRNSAFFWWLNKKLKILQMRSRLAILKIEKNNEELSLVEKASIFKEKEEELSLKD